MPLRCCRRRNVIRLIVFLRCIATRAISVKDLVIPRILQCVGGGSRFLSVAVLFFVASDRHPNHAVLARLGLVALRFVLLFASFEVSVLLCHDKVSQGLVFRLSIVFAGEGFGGGHV